MQIEASHEGPAIKIVITGEPWENADGEGLRITFTCTDPSYLRRFWGELGNVIGQAERAGF